MSRLLLVISLTLSSVPAIGQTLTIPERLAREKGPLTSGYFVPSGPPIFLDSLIADADLVVRATIGAGTSHLTPDQRDVFTDYPLLAPMTANGPYPGPISVTILGGQDVLRADLHKDRSGAP